MPTKTLKLARDLKLPLEIATQAVGIVASRGAGKTYTSKVLTEELAKAGIPTVVIDPMGVYWGLRSSADGRSAGLPFVILGGDHADVPLEPTGGRVIAKFVLANRVPVVLDLSLFRKAPMRRFVHDFLDELYHRNHDALHLVIDEADLFAPQRPGKDALALLGVMEDVVRRGRAKGLGCTLITQRPAVLHKDVLTQVAVLIALRLGAPQDIDAIKAWIESHASGSERREVLDSLPGLATGDGWFWSPSFMGVLQRFRARPAETFDSSATPKVGETKVVPKTFAEVDLAELKDQMAETIERAEATDPTALKRKVTDLTRQLARAVKERDAALSAAEQAQEPVEVVVERVVDRTVEVCPPAILQALDALARSLPEIGSELVEAHRIVEGAARTGREADAAATEHQDTSPMPPARQAHKSPEQSPRTRRPTSAPTPSRRPANTGEFAAAGHEVVVDDDVVLAKADRSILSVLAQFPEGRTKVQLALLSGYSFKSSSLANSLGKLRSAGYVAAGNPIRATDVGVAALGDFEPLPTGEDLLRHWKDRLGKAEVAILDAMIECWPDAMTKDELSDATGYSATSSSMANSLGKLRSLEMIDGWSAHDDFIAAITT